MIPAAVLHEIERSAKTPTPESSPTTVVLVLTVLSGVVEHQTPDANQCDRNNHDRPPRHNGRKTQKVAQKLYVTQSSSLEIAKPFYLRFIRILLS